MSHDPKVIEKHIIEVLRHSKPMSKDNLIRRIAADLANGEIEDVLIDSVIERLADRMIILETGSGKYRLNE